LDFPFTSPCATSYQKDTQKYEAYFVHILTYILRLLFLLQLLSASLAEPHLWLSTNYTESETTTYLQRF
jgi:hypothetical protein